MNITLEEYKYKTEVFKRRIALEEKRKADGRAKLEGMTTEEIEEKIKLITNK